MLTYRRGRTPCNPPFSARATPEAPLVRRRRDDRRVRGRLDLRRSHRRPSWLEGDLQDLVDVVDSPDLDRVENFLGDVDQVPLVLLGEDEDLDPGAVRREKLLLHSTDRQDATA